MSDELSIYTQCATVARQLANGERPFDERDVARLAEEQFGPWSDADRAKARVHAKQALHPMYRTSKLVRFGPVKAKDAPMTSEDDYVRFEGYIVHAPFRAWIRRRLETPNGSFRAIRYGKDPVFKEGRRKMTTRDDRMPWSEQIVSVDDQVLTMGEAKDRLAAALRDVRRLESLVETLRQRSTELEVENERLRTQHVSRAKA